MSATSLLRDWSLITGRGGGATKREIAGPKLFSPPPIQDRVKLFAPPTPLLKSGNFLRPPPPSIWLKIQATAYTLPQNMLCPPPPSAWLKHFLSFCSPPPPLPVISDQSLKNTWNGYFYNVHAIRLNLCKQVKYNKDQGDCFELHYICNF